jgi:hypothetical protein
LAIKEFSGGGRWGIILLPEGREKWGWCGFGKVLRFMLEPYHTVKQFPLAFHGDPCVGKPFTQTTLAIKTPFTSAILGGSPGFGAASSSDTTPIYDEYFKTKPEAAMETHCTGKKFPPAFHGDPCIGMPFTHLSGLLKLHSSLQILVELLVLVQGRARMQRQWRLARTSGQNPDQT